MAIAKAALIQIFNITPSQASCVVLFVSWIEKNIARCDVSIVGTIMTSSHENAFRVIGPPITGWFII